MKLVDTLASGASARKGVEVQVLFWAPESDIACIVVYRNILAALYPPVTSAYDQLCYSYLEQRPSGYYLRYTIPRHQRHLLRTRQLRYSLHNPSKKLAIKVARAVVSRIEVLLAATQRRREVLDDKTIRETIRRYVLEEQS